MISIISLIFPKNFLNYLWRYFGLGIFGKSIIYYLFLVFCGFATLLRMCANCVFTAFCPSRL